MARSRTPRWYFSLRSPYSWFAYRELVADHPGLLADMEWIPYWEPDAATARVLAERDVRLALTEMPRAKNRYILQDVRRVAAARGLPMTWPLDREPRWEVPHLAYLAAEERGAGRVFVDAAYRARWEQGRDICSPEVIGEIAEEIGVDRAPLVGAADDPAWQERGVAVLERGERDDVFGVPFFLHGRDKFWGVERLGMFTEAVRGAARPAETAPVAEVAPTAPEHDGGHAGGCG